MNMVKSIGINQEYLLYILLPFSSALRIFTIKNETAIFM